MFQYHITEETQYAAIEILCNIVGKKPLNIIEIKRNNILLKRYFHVVTFDIVRYPLLCLGNNNFPQNNM